MCQLTLALEELKILLKQAMLAQAGFEASEGLNPVVLGLLFP